jgi:uncharacterized membrane protein
MNRVSPAAVMRGAGLAFVMIAWAVLAHINSAGSAVSDGGLVLALAPLLAAAMILLWRVGDTVRTVLGGLAAIGLLAWLWASLRQNVALVYFIQHLGTNLALGALFGRSLRSGGTPLVTHFALFAHNGVIPPSIERYTRQVTIAWTVFFLASASASALLFFFAPQAAWSVFANLLTFPLVLLMFAVELLFRRQILPPEERTGVADTLRGYRAAMRHRANSLARHP